MGDCMSTTRSVSGLPFDDIRLLFDVLPQADLDAVAAVRERDVTLVKPLGSLGRLETIVEWMAAWQGMSRPSVRRPVVCVFASNHGVVRNGVSAFPMDVTRQMLETYSAGGGVINQICATHDFGFKVFDLALDLPTGDITTEAALDEKACVATMAFGMEAIAGGADLIGLGEMGIGNTTIAAAIYAALYGGDVDRFVGRGAGADDAQLARKRAAVAMALAAHGKYLDDPLEILRRLGGRDIAALAGAILAARSQRIPVVLDGYVVTAAAAILHAIEPSSIDHCVAGHVSAEGAHREVLERIGKPPLLDLGLRLGEGSGAALAMALIKTAVQCHNDTVTFSQAGISLG
jgi:nicotinate-nucleotide--dimethylbenzimidazole phosphoribosyltransferase